MGDAVYDDALGALDEPQTPQPAQPARDPNYDEALSVLRSTDQASQGGLRRAVVQSVDTQPDRAAESRRLSLTFGVPAPIIERNFDDYAKRDQVEKPYGAIQQQTPHTAQWLQESNNAAIAKDDLEKLGLLEWLTTAPQRAFARGVDQMRYAGLRYDSMFRDLSQEERDQLASYKYNAETGGALGVGNSWFRGAVAGGAAQIPMLLGAGLMGAKYGVAGALSAGAFGAAGGSIIPGAGTVAGGLAAGGYGYAAGQTYGSYKFMFQLEAGQAYDRFLALKDESGKPLDPQVARVAALGVGVINGALGTFGLEKLAESIPGIDKLKGAITRGAVEQALASPTIRAALAQTAKAYAGNLGTQTAVAVGMDAVRILGTELAKTASGQNIPHVTPQDAFTDLVHSGVGAAEDFALLSAVGPALSLARGVREASVAQHNADYFNALGDATRESKTVQRAPDGVRELLERATDQGPIQNVYAPLESWTTYWQSKGVDPAEMARQVTGDPEAFDRAQESGTDLKIPTARYATTIAPSEHNAFFANELRLQPDEMNTREAQAFLEEARKAPPIETAPTARDQVREQIRDRLIAAQVPADTAEHYARLVEAGVGTMAEQAGLDPFEVFQRYGVQVERPTGEGAPAEPARAPEAAQSTEEVPATGVPQAASFTAAGEPQDASGRALGGYAGPERRVAQGEAPGGQERRLTPMEQVRIDLQNPEMRAAAAQLEARAQAAHGKRFERERGGGYARAIAGIDTGAAAAQTELGHDTGTGPEGASAGEAGRPSRAGLAPSTPIPGERESRAQLTERRDQHFSDLHAAVADAARAIDPTVDVEALHREVDSRVELLADLDKDYAESGSNPKTILQAIAQAGGISLEAERGGYEGELKWVRESKHFGKFGAFAGVRGVFRAREVGSEGLAKTGLSLDDMARMLSQTYPEIQTPDDMLAILENVARFGGGDQPKSNVFPGTSELGIDLGRAWWKAGGPPVSEFGQGLFDLFDAVADPNQAAKADTLDTGEAQTRLPGDVGAVREQNVPTPEFDVPFALTSETIAPPRVRGEQPPSPAYLEAKAADDEAQAAFREATRAYRAREIDDATYLEARRVADESAQRFDTAFRLEQQRTQGRGPSTLFQPLYHGSPHDFERFSLQHVGTGEGAAAFGWGLYFAENRDVAAGYHDRLAGDPQVRRMKIGSLVVGQMNDFDYTRFAHVSDLENIRASLTEDLLTDPLALLGAGEHGFREHVLEKLDQRIKDYETEWPEGVAPAKELRAALAKPGALSIQFDPKSGGVYQVDIPDEHIAKMLDWDAPLEKQPAPVKELVREALKEKGYLRPNDNGPRVLLSGFREWKIAEGGMAEGATGEGAYNLLVQAATDRIAKPLLEERKALEAKYPSLPVTQRLFGEHPERFTGPEAKEDFQRFVALNGAIEKARDEASKQASLQLAAAGVPGLRYLDAGSRDTGKGTRNVVVFDDSIVTLTHKDGKPFTPAERKEFFQGQGPQERRGSIQIAPNRQITINLFERADLSTFLHETGHFFLEVFGDLAHQVGSADPSTLTDTQRGLLADYGAVLKHLGVEGRDEITAAHHEQFAREFERYLFEGKAPSVELRSSFARFRAWLIGVYRQLKNLGAPLTPEVRGVFDRMLATDRQIADAEASGHLEPLFSTAQDAGMSAGEFALYKTHVEDASRRAREELDTQLLSEVRRTQTAEYEARRDVVRAQVETELHNSPVYQALAGMRRGTNADGSPIVEGMVATPLKLSRAAIVDAYGEERLKTLPKGTYTREGGLDPDFVAQRYGFSSGDQMLQAIAGATNLKDAIEQETGRRMVQQYGSLLLDGSLPEKAQAAAVNEHRDQVVRAELRALWSLQRTVRPFVEQATRQATRERDYERRWFEAEAKLRIAIAEGRKQVEIDKLEQEVTDLRAQARGGAATIQRGIPRAADLRDMARTRVAGTRIGDLSPAQFWSASRRAAQQAIDAAARQDFEGAIAAKTSELVNLNLFRESERAKADVEQRITKIRELSKGPARARLGLAGDSYLDQVDAILDRYDFAKASPRVLERRASIAKFVEGLESQGLPVDLPDEVVDESRRTHFSRLTYEELQGVSDGLQQIVHLARLKNRLLKDVAGRELKATADGLTASVLEHTTQRKTDLEVRGPGTAGPRRIEQFFASHRKLSSIVRQMDGFQDGGLMWEHILRPLNAAADDEAVRVEKATIALRGIFDDAYKGEETTLYRKTFVPAIGDSLSKMARLMVALNWGNEGNRQRLMSGYRWTEEQVNGILSTLDARDWKFVNAITEHLDSYWPDIEAKQKRVYGLAPEKVAASPIQTAFGEQPGGYFPIKYENQLSPRAAANLEASFADGIKRAAYVAATTQRGHTKERLARVSEPLRLDFGVITDHVGSVIHDLTHHETLVDVGRLLAQRDVADTIYKTYGDVAYDQLKGAVRDIAFGNTPAPGWYAAINAIRAKTVTATLGWNAIVSLLHTIQITRGMVRVGPGYVLEGLGKWAVSGRNAEYSAKWITDVSDMMRLRWKTQQRELNEVRNQVGLDRGKVSAAIHDTLAKVGVDPARMPEIADSYFYMIRKIVQVAEIPTWIGAYEKAMDGQNGHERSVALADQAVIDSMGSGHIKDLAQVQRAPMARLLTTFYDYHNSVYNQAYELVKSSDNPGKKLVDASLLLFAPIAFGAAVHHAAASTKNQKEEQRAGVLKTLGAAGLDYGLGMYAGLRELSGAITGRDYEGPAGLSFIPTARHFLYRAGQMASDEGKLTKTEKAEALARSTNELAGELFGYPAHQVDRTVRGLLALMRGKAHDFSTILTGPKQ